MIRTGRAPLLLCVMSAMALAACGTGPAPNDVSVGVGFSDYQEYQARRTALAMPPATARPPADVAAQPFSTAPSATTTPTPTQGLADLAAAAIAEAESGATGLPPVAPGGDNFTAPPLPEGMAVLGARVVAFALSTSHPVGQRVWSRFPVRLGRPEVRCRDFRTTDLAQDWFLENEGPERDRAGLDPDGDGFACNWDPERYRAQAREASMPQPQVFPQASFTSGG
jgi:hypothetical protein